VGLPINAFNEESRRKYRRGPRKVGESISIAGRMGLLRQFDD